MYIDDMKNLVQFVKVVKDIDLDRADRLVGIMERVAKVMSEEEFYQLLSVVEMLDKVDYEKLREFYRVIQEMSEGT